MFLAMMEVHDAEGTLMYLVSRCLWMSLIVESVCVGSEWEWGMGNMRVRKEGVPG